MRTPVPKCRERKRKRRGMGSLGNRRATMGKEHAGGNGQVNWCRFAHRRVSRVTYPMCSRPGLETEPRRAEACCRRHLTWRSRTPGGRPPPRPAWLRARRAAAPSRSRRATLALQGERSMGDGRASGKGKEPHTGRGTLIRCCGHRPDDMRRRASRLRVLPLALSHRCETYGRVCREKRERMDRLEKSTGQWLLVGRLKLDLATSDLFLP